MGAFQNPFQAPSTTFGPVNGMTGHVQFTPYSATSAVTVANTVTETSLLGSGYGSRTIAANYLTVGDVIKIYLTGSISTDVVVPSITIKVYYGATVLSTATVTPAAQMTGIYFEYTSTVSVTTAGVGAQIVTGQVMWVNSLTSNGPVAVPSVQTCNTTLAGDIDVKITWGTASANNAITASTAYFEVIG